MGAALDTIKFVWDELKDGGKTTTSGTTVNVLPKGTTVSDLSDWQGPVSYPEKYEQLSAIFQSELADFTLTPNWQYNGQYIANFNVIVEGTTDVLSSIDVTVTTLEASYDDNDVAQLPYHIEVTFHNLTGGTQRTVFRARARGDGGGMDLE